VSTPVDIRTVRVAPVRPRRARHLGRNGPAVGALLLGCVLLRVVSGSLPQTLIPPLLRDWITLAVSVVLESLPFIFLGVFLSVVAQVWVPTGLVGRLVPRRGGLRRLGVSGLGLLLPVCECGNVPLARSLVSRGTGVSTAVTFLLAAPLFNPVTITTTYQAFGWGHGILIARVLGGLVIANLIGWVISRHAEPAQLLVNSLPQAHEHPGGRWTQSVEMVSEETAAMLPALFVGAGLAATIQVAVPRSFLLDVGGNPMLSVLALMTLAFVISICSNVDAFFALSLGATFMPGALVGFLVFGAMIDLKMLALLRTTFTPRAIAEISVLTFLAAFVLGQVVNLLA
jgi:uncharacterized membrane protein YraQ (UPF0718 family)